MIYITGDTHGGIDIYKLNTMRFPQQKTMNKDDFVIVAGDFGLGWNNGKEDLYWRNWLKNKNFTILFIDGNHENFDFLDSLPISQWNGGKVHFINESIVHLMRGQIFTIDGVKFFTFGGADSFDKYRRTPGVSWWERELPSFEEYNEGLDNLQRHHWQVDYIVTHDCSGRTFDELQKYSIGLYKYKTRLSDFLDDLEEKVSFKHWFFGHYHDDGQLDDHHTLLYKKMVKVL